MKLTIEEKQWLKGMLPLIDFLSCLTDQETQYLIENAQKSSYKINKIIVSQGQSQESFFIVGQGSVSVWLEKDGRKNFATRLGIGKYFGEMGIVNEKCANASIIADESAMLYQIDRNIFQQLIQKNPKLKAFIDSVISKRHSENQSL